MKILNLSVDKTWFTLISKGEKKEEYREIKDYWVRRLIVNKDRYIPLKNLDFGGAIFKHFDYIRFRNGYSKTSPSVLVECKGIRIANEYNMDWGGYMMTDGEGMKLPCFVISLGSIVKSNT